MHVYSESHVLMAWTLLKMTNAQSCMEALICRKNQQDQCDLHFCGGEVRSRASVDR